METSGNVSIVFTSLYRSVNRYILTRIYSFTCARIRIALELSYHVNSGVARSIIEGVHIHIFVFTDRKNNRFQKRLITQNTNI